MHSLLIIIFFVSVVVLIGSFFAVVFNEFKEEKKLDATKRIDDVEDLFEGINQNYKYDNLHDRAITLKFINKCFTYSIENQYNIKYKYLIVSLTYKGVRIEKECSFRRHKYKNAPDEAQGFEEVEKLIEFAENLYADELKALNDEKLRLKQLTEEVNKEIFG